MTTTPIELPDWVRGQLLLGRLGDGTIVPVLIDADGNINILLRGADAGGTVRTVRVDSAGQLYAVLRGADDVDVAVNAEGRLEVRLVGMAADGSPTWVKTDATGRIIMLPYGVTEVSGTATVTQAEKDREVQGADGATLRTLAVDASGQLVMVPRGQSGNYMSVDANGFLTAVLKGAHDATLTTIAVDANGRIDAFLMDGSDQWGQTIAIGNADQAGRLGSPVTYDWRGQVVWQTTFADGIGNLIPLYDGTGGFIGCVPDYSLMGGYSLKLQGGSDSDRYALAYGYIGRQPSRRMGVCVAFSNYAETTAIRIRIRASGHRYTGSIRYVWATGLWQYYGSDGAWWTFATQSFYITAPAFNFAKIVVDGLTHGYVRALVNESSYALSAHQMFQDDLGIDGTVEFDVTTVSRSGHNDYNLIDRIIVTSNEP